MNESETVMPFVLEPIGRSYLWGGNRLKNEFGKNLDMTPLAETWECSTLSDDVSIVKTGKHTGQLLTDVLKVYPEYLGSFKSSDGKIPVLIKFIDAQQNLSVQVHPDDNYAGIHENGKSGKNEMWYVLDAVPDAYLIYGFNKNMSREELKRHMENGAVETCLNKVPVKKGDVFFIEAGTVHAIGAGVLIAEIQQSSDLTYRLYDYNRVDADGKKRELHIQKVLDTVDLSVSVPQKQNRAEIKTQEELVSCPYFKVKHITVNEKYNNMNFQSDIFQILLCIEGNGEMYCNSGETLTFFKGDCIFVPANIKNIKIYGNTELLQTSLW